ncbi:hypothetical protein SK128_018575 [Halocaridina rubra]|uniref:RING-type domain-containing protein n=1 Tax=Halocaridina rubra TaxID=373956 RepID=A0AAN8ZWN4_HALRR
MGDLNYDKNLLAEEFKRLLTFSSEPFIKSIDNRQLAEAGFYFIQSKNVVKCFTCDLEFKAIDLQCSKKSIIAIHRDKKPECLFVHNLPKSLMTETYKTFRSPLESLRFEKCRLETFIDWPISFISPEDLARAGFFYLRIHDHCSCVFCKGIIGAWEQGDTPWGEHQKHFGQCPFVRGEAVGNIPMAECRILMKFNNKFILPKVCSAVDGGCDPPSEDVAGLGRQSHATGMISKMKVTQMLPNISLEDIGLCKFKVPEYKALIGYETRLETFKQWPTSCRQKPQDLAEAGFFNCGPGDHVICFHCGYGICNWEKDDDPWELHAYWYPKCNFVLLTKGLDFINEVRNGEPLEMKNQKQLPLVTDSDLNALMGLDVIKSVLARDFSERAVRDALRKRLEGTGLPFPNFDSCLDAVFSYVEEETRLFLEEMHKDENNEEDSSAAQNDNISNSPLRNISETLNSNGISLPPPPSGSTPTQESPLSFLRTHALVTDLQSLPRQDPNCTTAVLLPSVVTASEDRRLESLRDLFTSSAQSDSQSSSPPSQTHFKSGQRSHSDLDIFSSSGCGGLLSAAAIHSCSDKLQEELDQVKDTLMCKVCMDAEMCIIFLPCLHMATCVTCTLNLTSCPVCRQQIKYTIKPIVSGLL